jgi:hypothetical protein
MTKNRATRNRPKNRRARPEQPEKETLHDAFSQLQDFLKAPTSSLSRSA